MANDCAAQIQAVRMRVAKLDGIGVPQPGAGNLYVTDALISLQIEPVIEEGEVIQQKNAQGQFCVNYKDDDRVVRYNTTLQVCTPEPQLAEMLMGGSVFTSGGDAVGYGFPALGDAPAMNGVSVEVWAKAIVDGSQPATRKYWWWVLPLTKWRPSTRMLENAAHVPEFVGFAQENNNWFNGPGNDWAFASDKAVQYARTNVVPPVVCGSSTLSAS